MGVLGHAATRTDPSFGITMSQDISSLRSEICRSLRIQVGCTHARTTKNHRNAFLWSLQKAILKFASRKIGRNSIPILCIVQVENHQFWGDFSPESHIKICQRKNWAKFFPYSLYSAGWKSSIMGWFFPIGLTSDFEKRQFGPVRPTFIQANFNMCLLTPQRNALLWSRLVLGWVQRNLNFGSLDRRL